MSRPPLPRLAFVAGIAATAATLARLEEGDRSIEYEQITLDAFTAGLCAGIFLTAYSLAAAVGGLLAE